MTHIISNVSDWKVPPDKTQWEPSPFYDSPAKWAKHVSHNQETLDTLKYILQNYEPIIFKSI